MSDNYVSFGEAARRRCGMQAQYCSRYIDWRHENPRLADGLRFRGDPLNYHFVEYRRDTWQIA